MIDKKIVFILGAGASMPFGFPSGPLLLQNIYNEVDKFLIYRGEKNGYETFRSQFSYSNEFYINFCTDIQRGGPSIDIILNNRPNYLTLGKLLIASIISRYENENLLFDLANRDNWLKHLYSYMLEDSNKESFKNNKVSFITFNYDRSIEHFLIESLKASFGLSFDEANKILSCFKIVHVNGYLGSLKEFRYHIVDIKSQFNTLKKMTENIELIYNKKDNNEIKMDIYDLIENANMIYLMGFGYNRKNIDAILNYRESEKKELDILGTAYDMGKAQIYWASEHLKKYKINLNQYPLKNLEFLKDYFPPAPPKNYF